MTNSKYQGEAAQVARDLMAKYPGTAVFVAIIPVGEGKRDWGMAHNLKHHVSGVLREIADAADVPGGNAPYAAH